MNLRVVNTNLHGVKTNLHGVKTNLHGVKTNLHGVKTNLCRNWLKKRVFALTDRRTVLTVSICILKRTGTTSNRPFFIVIYTYTI